jgi:NAD(P)-dependent dehydrogenase (short-subunit alcohol dehydrogenase family)
MKSKLFSLEGRVIAMTGGYGWLGAAIAKGLVSHGGRVFILGRNRARFEAALGDQSVDFVHCDVEKSSSIDAAFAAVVRIAGGLNVVINNAFYCRGSDPEAISDDDWAYSLDGTLGTVHRSIRASIPHLKKQGDSRIINVASIYGLVSPDFSIYAKLLHQRSQPYYGAAKAAIIQLTRYYAVLLGPYGTKVNCVTPGAFPSEKVQANAEFIAALGAKAPLGRIGRPEELQGAFVFLSSPAASYVTGHNLVVDGGWTAW